MIYLQGNNGLIPLKQELSRKKIIQLLGLTPSSQEEVKKLQEQLNNKQPVGDYALRSEIPSTSGLATEFYVETKITELINAAPEALDTLKELAAALGDDPHFSTTIMTQIGKIQSALTIDYNTLAFDTTEIVFDSDASSILGQAILGQMILA